MKVEDVFRFANGTTLFLGTITSEAKFIGACDCEIIVDGKARLSAYVSEVYPTSATQANSCKCASSLMSRKRQD